MATGSTGSVGQVYHTNQVHYFAKEFGFADGTAVQTLGVIPAGATVLRGGVVVREAFNAGTNNRLDIGTSGDDDGFATDISLTTVGVIAADEMATSNDMWATTDVTITFTPDITGTAATTGKGTVWVEYIVPNSAR